MSAARQERLLGALQVRLDACTPGAVIELSSGEYEGPITIRRAVTLSGRPGVTLWARSGPVVTVAALGVALRGLCIEVTDLPSQVSSEGACALDLTAAPDLRTEDVSVVGTITGAPDEHGQWAFPAWFDLGKLRPFQDAPLRKRLRVTVPVACAVRSAVAGLVVEPQALEPGTHDLHLLLDPAGTRADLEGHLFLETRLASRKIAIAACAAARPAARPLGPPAAMPPSIDAGAGPLADAPPAPPITAPSAPPAGAQLVAVPEAHSTPGAVTQTLPSVDAPTAPSRTGAIVQPPPPRRRWLLAAVVALGALIAWATWAAVRSPAPGHFTKLVPLPAPAAGPTLSVALSPDGSVLARGGAHGVAELFDSGSGRLKWQLDSKNDSAVRAVAFSRDGKTVASGGDDHRVWLWDARQGMALTDPLRGANDGVRCLAFSPDGTLLAAGEKAAVQNGRARGGQIRLWDTRTGQQVTAPESDRNGDVLALAFSADGNWLVSGGEDHRLLVWNVRTHDSPLFRGFGDARVLGLAISADGEVFAAGLSDHTARLWGRAETEPRLALPAVRGAVLAVWLSADARVLATADETGAVAYYDTRTGAGKTLPAPAKAAAMFAFSLDGRTMASADRNGTLSAWRGE